MAGKLYYSRGDPDLLKLLVLWEAEENASRYELVEGGRYLGGNPHVHTTTHCSIVQCT